MRNFSTGLKLTVYQNRRWDDDFLKIEDVIEEKLLGDVHYFESNVDYFKPDVTFQILTDAVQLTSDA